MEQIIKKFLPNEDIVSLTPFGGGLINKTVKISARSGQEYILQKINHYVFQNPEQLMENICAVTDFLRQKDPSPYATLTFIKTDQGKALYITPQGEYWRMCTFIPGFCLQTPETPEDFYQSALAFGRFQQLLQDFPARTLHITIPDYHNTPKRFEHLKQAIAEDKAGRLQGVGQEVAFLLQRESLAGQLQSMLEQGVLPLRVTHNDTKLNNVLLDPVTRKNLCVLDLDTVMPGLTAHDFGDAIRFGAATAPEDTKNLQQMGLDLTLFEVFAKGFLQTATLIPAEISVLPLGALTLTIELATRFLTDYLQGDKYFTPAYPHHNLVRARAQAALAADMERKMPEMEKIIARLTKNNRLTF